MTSLFTKISPASAQRYCDLLAARSPAMLSDLAYRLHQSGGPIESMNGSKGSLKPLWAWFVGQFEMGLPGIPSTAQPAAALAVGTPLDEQFGRVRFAAEPIVEYVFQVLRSSDSSAHWAVASIHDPRNSDFQRPVVRTRQWGEVKAEDIGDQPAVGLVSSFKRSSRRERLFDILCHATDDTEAVAENAPSILTRWLERPPVPADDPIRRGPVWSEVQTSRGADVLSPVVTEGYFIAHESMDPSRPELAVPLDAETIAASLRSAGWHVESAGPVTADQLRSGYHELVLGDGLAVMQSTASDGQLRLLSVEPMTLTETQWDSMEIDLLLIASSVGAKFGPSYEFGRTV
jgi:hypothetical protein